MDSIHEKDVEGVRVKVELEAEDSLAVRLKTISMEGRGTAEPVRTALERQAHAIVDKVAFAGRELAVIEVDGVSNAVQIRTRKPEAPGRFVEVILRDGNRIKVEARGGAVHLSKEEYEGVVDTLAGVLRGGEK